MTKFCNAWGNGLSWYTENVGGPHEANFLKLDCTKIKHTFEWTPRWHIDEALDKIAEWTKVYLNDINEIPNIMDKQINEFFNLK